MPRPKTRSDAEVLDGALKLMHDNGPEALSFGELSRVCGLSASTLVQRFGTKADLVQRTMLHAWDQLDARTLAAGQAVPRSPKGAIAFLVDLSRTYGGIESYAEGLLMLREDLRDPVLRARGAAWKDRLCLLLGECFDGEPGVPPDIGLLLAAQWQGALLWWAFDPTIPVERHVEDHLRRFLALVVDRDA